ncbi:hypothetical protein FKW77_007338 [Venturia effusa]|uniref:Helicase C-terminal domain-containing protein n=1 Tax=Venturia effusa TaxID=50376 RepID=A0A517L9J4_9PEZI|nr:hypothetical protein FKW77_007338 [Venturia effusa]
MDDLLQAFPISISNSFGIAEDSDSQFSSSTSPAQVSDSSSEDAAAKKKKAVAPSWGSPGASVPASPSNDNGSLTPTSTISSSSKNGPKALLDPRPGAVPRRSKRDTPSEEDLNDDDAEVIGMSSMLSQVHGLRSRENAPNKRQKVNDEIDDKQSKSTAERADTGGQMGHALKEERRRLQESQPTDEDEECIVVGQTNNPDNQSEGDDREVCLGKIPFFASASLIPGPKPESKLQPTATRWPAMRLDFRVGAALIINLIDPARRHFAKVDIRTATALRPLLVSGLGVRPKFTLDARPRLSSENPGSPASTKMKVTMLLFAPRKHVVQIGRMLTMRGVKLEDTNAGLLELVNPHTVSAGYVNRTNEEVTSDVLNMFDSITKTEDLPEMKADPRIATELLKHQKQGLYFMTKREKIAPPNSDSSDDGFVLWCSKVKENGSKIWYNVISGHEASHRPPPIRGGILADMMGLGKTLSILAMLVSSLDEAAKFATFSPPRTAQRPLLRNSKATLLVCPTKALVASLLSFNEWSVNNPDEPRIKSVVFSYWTSHLDLIQYALEANNITYTRLDGRMARKARGKAIEAFRDDPEIQVILVSIGAGGVGLNLTAASKVFMMEPQYNPAAEAQAVERVHRLGQRRDVEIVRYIMRGSIEEAILEIQKAKTEMADMTMNRNHKVSKAQEQMETLQRYSRMLGNR